MKVDNKSPHKDRSVRVFVCLCVRSLAGLVRTRSEDGGDGMSVADGAEVFFTRRLETKTREDSWGGARFLHVS